MELQSGEFVMLQGKRHPLYRGVLRLAGESGLKRLAVRLVQAPGEDNGGMAICEATAVFTSPDGQEREFVEIGDCDGSNCGKMIAPHRVRMAATRAKGRALRDALGIGEALLEELGGPEETTQRNGSASDGVREQGRTGREAPASGQSRARGSSAPVVAAAVGGSEKAGSLAAGTDAAVVAPLAEFWCSGCGQQIKGTTKRPAAEVARLSREGYGSELCVHCVAEKQALASANVPSGELVS